MTGVNEGFASCFGCEGVGLGGGGLEEAATGAEGAGEERDDDKFVRFFSVGAGVLEGAAVGVSGRCLGSSMGDWISNVWKRAILKRRISEGSRVADSFWEGVSWALSAGLRVPRIMESRPRIKAQMRAKREPCA